MNITYESPRRLDFVNTSNSKGLSFISANQFVFNQTMKSSDPKEYPSIQILSDDEGDLNELIEAGDGSNSESSGENFHDENPLSARTIDNISIKFDSFAMEKQDVSPGHLMEDPTDGTDT